MSIGEDFEKKVEDLAATPHRVIALAYTELKLEEWEKLEQSFTTPSHCLADLVQTGKLKFILLGAFALRDQVRPKVRSAVAYARDQG